MSNNPAYIRGLPPEQQLACPYVSTPKLTSGIDRRVLRLLREGGTGHAVARYESAQRSLLSFTSDKPVKPYPEYPEFYEPSPASLLRFFIFETEDGAREMKRELRAITATLSLSIDHQRKNYSAYGKKGRAGRPDSHDMYGDWSSGELRGGAVYCEQALSKGPRGSHIQMRPKTKIYLQGLQLLSRRGKVP
ncbi:hypothetical protein FOZ60_010990 [Perkinsus olseni]|uniref:Uncharacterized protein n=1 Tax=Perkinsus olseni TaxID=32597 RepID=A0A7J6NFB9_PEROL|nr:hypothetical protein FOZ60_010990 [Perkinsus olseni]